jgi:type I restriction enzyme, S subunit
VNSEPYNSIANSSKTGDTVAPKHWKNYRLRFHLIVNPKKSEIKGLDDSELVSFVPMESINEYGGMNLDQKKPLYEVVNGYTYFRNDDLVLAKITPCFENGKGSIADGLENGVGFGTTELHVLRPKESIDLKYLFYLTITHIFRNIGASWMYGAGGQKRVPEDFIKNFRHTIPPIDEQQAIALFLDNETLRIDTLIRKKERQIELLEEKRSALIHDAIQNPRTRSMRIGHVVDRIFRPVIRREDDEYIPVGLYNRGRGIFHKEQTKGVSLGDSNFFWIKSDDLILSGQFAWEGAVALASNEEEGCVASHRYPILRGKPNLMETAYLFAFFTTKTGDFLLNEHSRGAAGRNRPLNPGTLLKESIPVPPIEAQARVSDHVYFERRIDRIVKRSIKVLQEYRTALITAAVTGQIDVRKEAA